MMYITLKKVIVNLLKNYIYLKQNQKEIPITSETVKFDLERFLERIRLSKKS
jgi:hypothetical protein